jgi:preprotein translocase subunit SecA
MLEKESNLTDDDLLERVLAEARRLYEEKIALVGEAGWRPFERSVLLQSLDTNWRAHLASLDHLRQGIHLRGYAQVDPKQAYKREAFTLFSDMLDRIRNETIRVLMTVRIQSREQVEVEEPASPALENVRYHHADYDAALRGEDPGLDQPPAEPGRKAATPAGAVPRVGRNDPCPCGSGKKYKHCHGQLK